MTKNAEIWVFCEEKDHALTANSRQLLGKARLLGAETGRLAAAVLFTEMAEDAAAQAAIAYGADRVYQWVGSCPEEAQAGEIARLLGEERPWAFLFPATTTGTLVAAMLSVKLKTGLTAACTALSVEGDFLCQTRPAFGGSLLADILCSHSLPQMATVQAGVFPMPSMEAGRSGRVTVLPVAAGKGRILHKRIREMQTETPLEDAEIVLAGGMGLGSAEGFLLLEQAAKRLGAVPAASRAAVNAGFAPYAWQIGQSGKTIRPRLYIACGISGAVQHLAGIQGAGCIVAVNRDKKAPIFRHADIGIRTDCAAFLQKLLDTWE